MLSIWDPFVEFNRVRRDFDAAQVNERRFTPAVDIEELEGKFVVRAELPGVKREDVHIQVHEDVLTIRGERKLETKEGDGKRYQRVERRYGTFVRSFALPKEVDASAIEAKLSDGVLELTVPKKAEVTPRRIEVNAA